MAGTGHSYEIANLNSVVSFLKEHAEKTNNPETKKWITSSKLIKFYTSLEFTDPATELSLELLKEEDKNDDLIFLQKKITEGKEVKLFSTFKAKNFGPDLSHAIDWLKSLEGTDDKKLSKLSKMTVQQVVKASTIWSPWKNKVSSRGLENIIMHLDDGMFWVEMLDAQALIAEGNTMKHCIGGYNRALERGDSRFFSLRSSENHSAISLHAIKAIDTLYLSEVKSYANKPVPFMWEQNLIDFLNFLKIKGKGRQQSANIIFNNDKWEPLIKTYKEITWRGHVCYLQGRSLFIRSKILPSNILMEVHLSENVTLKDDNDIGEIKQNQIDTGAVIFNQETRHFHIEEIREVAAIYKALGVSDIISFEKYIRYFDGEITPIIDILERKEIGGIPCLLMPNFLPYKSKKEDDITTKNSKYEILIPHSNDEGRIMARIGKNSTDYFSRKYHGAAENIYEFQALKLEEPERLNITETNRILSVINELKSVNTLFGPEEDDKKYKSWLYKFKPRKITATNRWMLLSVEGMTQDIYDNNHISIGYWLYTDSIAELYLNSQTTAAGEIRKVFDNRVAHISNTKTNISSGTLVNKEIINFLNQHRWDASEYYYWNNFSSFDKDSLYRNEMLGIKEPYIFQLHGKWQSALDDNEIIAAFSKKEKNKRKIKYTSEEANALIRLIGFDYISDEVDQLLIIAIEQWIKSIKIKSYIMYPQKLNTQLAKQAMRFHSLLSERMQNKMVNFFASLVLPYAKKKKYHFFTEEQYEFILLLLPYVDEKNFEKIVLKLIQSSHSFNMPQNNRLPDNRWLSIYERAKEIKLTIAAKIRNDSCWIFFHIANQHTFINRSIEYNEAVEWLKFAKMSSDLCLTYEANRILEGIDVIIKSMHETSKNTPEKPWDNLFEEYDKLIAYLNLADEREKERKEKEKRDREEWMQRMWKKSKPVEAVF